MSSVQRTWAVGAMLLLLTVGAYASVLATGGYIWDDDDHLTNVKAVKAPDGLKEIWTEPRHFIQFYPMVFTSFNLEYRLWGGSPRGYHFTNVLLHGINAFLVWLILRRLNVPGALLAALLFAVHPVMVESVAWITERKNVLSAFFYLTAMLAYSQFEPAFASGISGGKRRWGFYALSVVLLGMGLLSKSVVCSFPVALVILLWYRVGRVQLRDLWPLVPMLVIGAMAGLYTATLEHNRNGASGTEFAFSFMDRVLIAGRALLFYPVKLLVPVRLTFIYPRWDIHAGVWWQYLFPLGAAVLVAVPFLMIRR